MSFSFLGQLFSLPLKWTSTTSFPISKELGRSTAADMRIKKSNFFLDRHQRKKNSNSDLNMALHNRATKSASQSIDTSTQSSERLEASKSAEDGSALPIQISSPQSYLRIGQEKMRNGEFSQSKNAFREAYLAFEVILLKSTFVSRSDCSFLTFGDRRKRITRARHLQTKCGCLQNRA
jgi:hypothetical protein